MVTKVTGSFSERWGEHMNQNDGFYTMKGYRSQSDSKMTSAMEDYLEMITRLSGQGGSVRVSELSRMLHVKASSATKMVQQLVQEGFVLAERYGDIALTEEREGDGKLPALPPRRNSPLSLSSGTIRRDELEQAEKIEHFLTCETVKIWIC